MSLLNALLAKHSLQPQVVDLEIKAVRVRGATTKVVASRTIQLVMCLIKLQRTRPMSRKSAKVAVEVSKSSTE